MKFFKKPSLKMPMKLKKLFVKAYNWGFDECESGLKRKSDKEIFDSLDFGFKEGQEKQLNRK